MEKKWYQTNFWKVIGTVLLSIIISIIKDLFDGVQVLSTLINISKWVWNVIVGFFNLDVKMWLFVVLLLVGVLIRWVVQRQIEKSEDTAIGKSNDSYQSDVIFGTKWRWSWRQYENGNYDAVSLTALCGKCDTPYDWIREYGKQNNPYIKFVCPRCEHSTQPHKPEVRDTAYTIIMDNQSRKWREIRDNFR